MFARVPSPEIAERFRPLPEGEVMGCGGCLLAPPSLEVDGWGEGVRSIASELHAKLTHRLQTTQK